jgi:hypothetical protein
MFLDKLSHFSTSKLPDFFLMPINHFVTKIFFRHLAGTCRHFGKKGTCNTLKIGQVPATACQLPALNVCISLLYILSGTLEIKKAAYLFRKNLEIQFKID